MPMIQEGQKAPQFSLADQHGKTWSLAELQGKNVVVYFYPKDDTPGCTVEACGFRDLYKDLEDAGAVVLGLSPDTTASHKKFADKYQLPFTLLADVGHSVADAFGVWGEKKNYGKTYMGIHRATFLIDPAGTVKKVWPKVSPAGHNLEVLAAIRGEEPPAPAKKVASGAKVKKSPPAAPRSATRKAPLQKPPSKKAPPAKKAPGKKAPPAKRAPGKSAPPAKKAPGTKGPPAKKAPGVRAPAKKAATQKAAAKKPARR